MINAKIRLLPHDAAAYIGGISYDKLMMMVRNSENRSPCSKYKKLKLKEN